MLALLLVFSLGCTFQPTPPEPKTADPAPASPLQCEPTLTRMVPPDFVMDHILGGIQQASNIPNPTVPVPPQLWAAGHNFLGTEGLWLDLPTDGNVRGRSISLTAYQTTPGRIEVSARRLDLSITHTVTTERDENPGGGPRDRAITIHFPTRGCWEITYSLGRIELRFVLAVEGS